MNEEYLLSLYNYIVESDPSYKEDVSFEQFKSGMADQQYAASMYGYIGDLNCSKLTSSLYDGSLSTI